MPQSLVSNISLLAIEHRKQINIHKDQSITFTTYSCFEWMLAFRKLLWCLCRFFLCSDSYFHLTKSALCFIISNNIENTQMLLFCMFLAFCSFFSVKLPGTTWIWIWICSPSISLNGKCLVCPHSPSNDPLRISSCFMNEFLPELSNHSVLPWW